MGGLCVFLQGACGDLETDLRGLDTISYGEVLGDEVVRIARSIHPAVPPKPSIAWREEEFRFQSRIELSDSITYLKYCAAFFKDLVDAFLEEYREGVRPSICVAVLNGEVGIVSVSGELFSNHAVRLRERARRSELLVLGFTNGYHQYFPTLEAVTEGGYGAGPDVSPVAIGAGERMMNRAWTHLDEMK